MTTFSVPVHTPSPAAHQATPGADRVFDLRARPLGVPAIVAQARVARIRQQLAGLALTA